MFVLVLAVPALLVVLTGYVLGYLVVEWIFGLVGADVPRAPEVAGWTSGLVLLAVVVWLLLARRRGGGRGRRDPHQK